MLEAVILFAVGARNFEPSNGIPMPERLLLSILGLERSDGGVVFHDGRANVYFGDYAMIGALDLASSLGQRETTYAVEKAERWLSLCEKWRTEDNHDGIIFDRHFTGDSYKVDTFESGLPRFDSADGYASAHLWLLKRTLDLDPAFAKDATAKAAYEGSLKELDDCLIEVSNPLSGLTYNFSDQRVKEVNQLAAKFNDQKKQPWVAPACYAMDNVESWFGYTFAHSIALKLGDKSNESRTLEVAEKLEGEFDATFYDPSWNGGIYRVAKQLEPSSKAIFIDGPIEKWYPPIMANLVVDTYLPASRKRSEVFSRLKKLPLFFKKGNFGNPDELTEAVWTGMAAASSGDKVGAEAIRAMLRPYVADHLNTIARDNVGSIGHLARFLFLSDRSIRPVPEADR